LGYDLSVVEARGGETDIFQVMGGLGKRVALRNGYNVKSGYGKVSSIVIFKKKGHYGKGRKSARIPREIIPSDFNEGVFSLEGLTTNGRQRGGMGKKTFLIREQVGILFTRIITGSW